MSSDDWIKNNRLFILGAGFSAAAGIPMIGQLLEDCMSLFNEECPGICWRINNYAKTCFSIYEGEPDYSEINFANLCTFLEYIELREYGGGERFSDNGSREKLAFRFYLAKAIINSMPKPHNIPQLYLDFAKQLRKDDVIITFNWDPLLELAIENAGRSYSYSYRDRADIVIHKFHGSVNWRLAVPDKPDYTWQPLGLAGGMMKEDIYHNSESKFKATWETAQPFIGDIEPYLVLPGAGKAYDVRPLAPLWYKPEFAFSTTHNVFVIGLSLSDDDFFIKSLFLDSLPDIESFTGIPDRKVRIINPDPNVMKNYSFIVGKEKVEFIHEKFSDAHIKMIQKDDSNTGNV